MNLRPFRDLPSTLVSRESAAALEAVAGQFASPAALLIECPLGEADAEADLSVSFSRPASESDTRLVAGGWPAGTAWERVRRFVEVWRDPDGPLWDDVRSLWLEFDLRRRKAAEPAALPNPFFGRSTGMRSRETTMAGLELLIGRDVAGQRHAVEGCLDAAPAGAPVLFAGVMLARRPPAIRFCVDGPPWRDAPADLIRLSRHTIVQVEAGAPADAPIGFELYQGRRQRGRADVWRALLDRLVEVGMARADRCAAALDWSGYASDGASGHVIARWINHVKVTCEAGGVVDAKVYLQFATAWEPASSDAGGPGSLSR